MTADTQLQVRGVSAKIFSFAPSHVPLARELWLRCDGIGLGAADEEPALLAYLARNPRTSFVALQADHVVGTVMCGHDGRRGLLHHLATAPEVRRQGLGRELLRTVLTALAAEGIDKCHLMVFASNAAGRQFWSAMGAVLSTDVHLMSLSTAQAC